MLNRNFIHPEIVAPAGNYEKLTFALNYGADAVYFGGEGFNLRVQADNFTGEEISNGVHFCKDRGVKTIFLLNSFLHENDIPAAREYIRLIKHLPFNAVMVSDPGMMLLAREEGIVCDLHLSTQMSTLNHLSIKFWNDMGIKRIVMAREVALDEIKKIRECTDAEIEIFIHGALCISYSGRCLLSRYLSGRDANSGECSHPCRWDYSLIESKRPGKYMDILEHAHGTEILSSKDLCLIEHVPEYMAAGVNAFKIEGRMKSVYHTANTTRMYKYAVQLAGSGDFDTHLPFLKNELDLINHRPYTDDLFNEFDAAGFTEIPYIKKAMFMGYKTGDTGRDREIRVKIHNPIYADQTLEVIFPINEKVIDETCVVEEIRDKDDMIVPMARPGSEYCIKFDRKIADYAIFRKRL